VTRSSWTPQGSGKRNRRESEVRRSHCDQRKRNDEIRSGEIRDSKRKTNSGHKNAEERNFARLERRKKADKTQEIIREAIPELETAQSPGMT